MGADEVLEDGHALAEVAPHGHVDDPARRVGHQAAHRAQLADVALVAAGTGVGHHPDGVLLAQRLHHLVRDDLGDPLPELDDLLVALVLGDEAALELLVDLGDVLVRLEHLRGLGDRHDDVPEADRHAAAGGELEADGLDAVHQVGGLHRPEVPVAAVHEALEVGALHGAVDEAHGLREDPVEQDPADRRADVGVDQADRVGIPGPDDDVDRLVEEQLGAGVVDGRGVALLAHAEDLAGNIEPARAKLVGGDRVVLGGERLDGPIGDDLLVHREVVAAEDHVLRGRHDRRAVGGREQVGRREHHHPRLFLRGRGQRHVDRHLVAVEVGVEGRADERVDLDRRPLDEHRHECLDAEAVQRGRAVQQDRVVLDDLFEDVPHLGADALHDALGALDVVGEALLDQLAHDERLEQLERHLLGQAALVELQVRPDDDDGAARVVHALAEQVLAEPALLALEHVRERLEAVVAGARDRPAAAAVVDQGVARLLEHPLLVADDDLGRAELQQPLEAVVAVDDAPVEVVQVGGREAAAVELDHRAQVGRDDRQDGQDHPLGAIAGPAERLDQAEPLDGLLAALPGARPDLRVEGARELLEVHPDDDVADGLGAHPGPEDAAGAGTGAVLLVELAELHLADRHQGLERLDLVAGAAELLLLALGLGGELLALGAQRLVHRGPEVVDLLLGAALLVEGALLGGLRDPVGLGGDDLLEPGERGLAALVARGDDDLARGDERDRLLGDRGAQGRQGGLDLLRPRGRLVRVPRAGRLELGPGRREDGPELVGLALDVGLERGLELDQPLAAGTAAALGLLVERLQGALTGLLVHVGDDVQGEVEDPLEVAGGDVEQDAEPARGALEVPDVADGAGQLDVAHPLTADLRARDLDAALVADDALVPDALVLPAVALPVPGGTEDALVEEPILLGLERPVVDGLGLRHLSLRPLPDLVRAGKRDADRREVVDLEHRSPPRRRGPGGAIFRFRRAGTGPAGRRSPSERGLRVVSVLEPGEVDPAEVREQVAGGVVLRQGDLLVVLVEDLRVEPEAPQLLDEDLEGLGDPRRLDLLALDDGFVGLDASEDIVRFHGEQLLEDVGGAVGLEGPHLHLAEPLAAELRLATQRLLGDEAVGAGGPGVDLVLHEVVKLEHVDLPDRDLAVEQLARAAVAQLDLAVLGQVVVAVPVDARVDERLADVLLGGAVEDRRRGLVAHGLERPAEVGLEDLADVHPARHPERVEDDVDRGPIREVGHVLEGQDLGDDSLVAVAAGHLVADRDLALLGDRDADQPVDARLQVVVPLAAELADLDHLAALAVREPERGVLHLARLLAEDRPQEPLLRGQLGLALGRDLADQDVPGADLRADIDDPLLVEVLQGLLADVRDVARDLLGAELRVPGLDLVLLDVDAGEQVVAHEALADHDRVLVVAALPAHERHEDVPAEGELAALGGGRVRDRVLRGDALPDRDDRALVDAGALVAAHELQQLVLVQLAAVGIDLDPLRGDAGHDARALGDDHLAGVLGGSAPPCRCPRSATRARGAAPPGAACSSP